MATLDKKRLGDILVRSGKITYDQLNEALMSQNVLGKKLGEILLDNGTISERDMMEAIKEQTGIKEIDLNMVSFDKKVIKMIPQNLCNKYTLIPFGFCEGKLQVAMHDPLNIFAIDDINIASGFEVEVFIDIRRNIKKFIDLNYSNEEVVKAAEELSTVNLIGIESLPPLVARIKILAGLNIAEKRIPQDGRIITKVDDKEVDLRVSILPVVYGEKVVIRILDKDNYKVGKEHLGLSNENIKRLNRIIANPHGMVLVTGPTGSGKSTTLYSILDDINSENINIVTVEDPVEYTLEGINQVNVNNKSGMTFASGLRRILRQDPDVIMIGEIRDDETAEIAVIFSKGMWILQ